MPIFKTLWTYDENGRISSRQGKHVSAKQCAKKNPAREGSNRLKNGRFPLVFLYFVLRFCKFLNTKTLGIQPQNSEKSSRHGQQKSGRWTADGNVIDTISHRFPRSNLCENRVIAMFSGPLPLENSVRNINRAGTRARD